MENDIREIFGRYNNDKSGREKTIAALTLYINKEKAKAEWLETGPTPYRKR